jgi:DNA segregation ATPase FtsK/SpoIIIE-like protein
MQVSLLGAKARAAGIHLILATQQPSREVIKGVLDSNIPARVGLMMVKREESKMLLGQAGAEHLLGKGDLLFRDVGDPIRLQAPLLSSI